jgi:1,4-dihydroxy-6-naphthoate synthase
MRVGFEKETYRAAISPCPNDTYIFGAWVLGMAGDVVGLRTRFIWEDVQTLNEMAAAGKGDLIKVSAVHALKLENDWDILSCGGAFGLGHGPKLVVLKKAKTRLSRIAVPGMLTTACALLKDCLDFDFEPVPMPFDQIPSAVVDSQVDAGLLIHETALIADQLGLDIILDLGVWWEERSSGLPLPLGLIIIKKSLGQKLKLETEKIIQDSIAMAGQGKPGIRSLTKQLARELDDDVINRHIQAYVNEYSTNMGEQGIRALSLLKKIA